jgi:L-ascorbate metabolism protein UlaG (beta-lactamase superfamily)
MTIVTTLSAIVVIVLAIDFYLRAPGYRGPKSDHFDGKKFKSYGREAAAFTVSGLGEERKVSLIKWMISRPRLKWEWRDVETPATPPERVTGKEILVTYVNHTAVLIQVAGVNIITDPVWTYRASPFIFMGPRRYQDPGVDIEKLPPIDLILLSHNHYDHMDLNAIRKIVAHSGPAIVAPLGNAAYLEQKGVAGAVDMDWWQSQMISKEVRIDCVPAQHFSARAFSDRNRTLWSGYMIHTPVGLLYFAGDTGYGPFVDRLKDKYIAAGKKIRCALLPIGAYKPEWFMKEVHMSPEEAVRVHEELGIETSIATHFGTFYMADDGQDEPVALLKSVLAEKELHGQKIEFRALKNGESVRLM